MIDEQTGEYLGETEQKPYSADAGVVGDNAEWGEAYVEFFHGPFTNNEN